MRVVIHARKSELIDGGVATTFEEGRQSDAAVGRQLALKQQLEQGFLEEQLVEATSGALPPISEEQRDLLTQLVDGVTQGKGRALVALALMQAAVKAIVPEQDVRLHKGSRSSAHFSWVEGVSLRSLDRQFVTPFLRSKSLLSLNKDGFMMTRGLAENYPYTRLYKSNLQGPRAEWLEVVHQLQAGDLDGEAAARHLLARLALRSEAFAAIAASTIERVEVWLKYNNPSPADVCGLLHQHLTASPNAARLLEVAMHALFQTLEDRELLGGTLVPLAQMRSANKKAGNIGDIEVRGRGGEIVEAWDAKHGFHSPNDALEELNEKLEGQNPRRVGFVSTEATAFDDRFEQRRVEVEALHNVAIYATHLEEWLELVVESPSASENALGADWLKAYAESLARRRLDRAPIDEPTFEWLGYLADLTT